MKDDDVLTGTVGVPVSPKFRFISVSEDCDVNGTNDPEKAKKAAEFTLVWDVVTGEFIHNTSEEDAEGSMDIEEMPEEWFNPTDITTL